jgi:hypothetical protein
MIIKLSFSILLQLENAFKNLRNGMCHSVEWDWLKICELDRGGDALGTAGVSLLYIAAGLALWSLVVYIRAMCNCLTRL